MKRVVPLTIVGLLSVTVFATGVAISQLSTEQLIICATTDDAFVIPKMACRFYFDKMADTSDAKQLDERAGIAFAFEIDDPAERSAIVERLIAIGADPNGVSKIDGLTPLNAAVLLNDVQLVQFLLDHGADKNKPDAANHLNAAEYVTRLQRVQPSTNRDVIAAMLVSNNL